MANMPINKLLRFFESYPKITYTKGEKILRPNEYSGHMYLVITGHIRMYKILSTGQEITFNRNDPRKQKFLLFGYLKRIADYYVEAFTDVVLHRVPKSEFEQF